MEDREERTEREERRKEEDRYEKLIKREEDNLSKMRDVQEEVNSLNKSLLACINIASDSIVNVALKKRYENMRQNNFNSYTKANRTVDNAIEVSKRNIARLQDEKIEAEERIKQEAREKEEREKKEQEEKEKEQEKNYSNE